MSEENILSELELLLPSFSTAGGEKLGPENRCFPGTSYYLGFKTTPSNFQLRDNLEVSLEVVEGEDLVESAEFKKSNYPHSTTIKFKSDVTGTVKVKMRIYDPDADVMVESNILELFVLPYHGKLADSDYWAPGPTKVDTSPIVLKVGESFDCSARAYLNKYTYYAHLESHKGESRYMYAYPSSYREKGEDGTYSGDIINSSSYISVCSNLTSIVGKNIGKGKVSIQWLQRYSSGAIQSSGSTSIPVTVIDDAEALGYTMNLRFKVDSIEVDRTTTFVPSWNAYLDPEQYYPGMQRQDSFGYFNKLAYLYETYDFHPTTWEDFLEFDDPNGDFDPSRLRISFEDDNGKYVSAASWDELECWVVARYGKLDETKAVATAKIRYRNITRNPNNIPIRDHSVASFATAHADELDFSKWYKASQFVKINPGDATINKCGFSMVPGFGDFIYTERIGTTGTLDEQYRIRLGGVGRLTTGHLFEYRLGNLEISAGVHFIVGLPHWDGYVYRPALVPHSRTFIPSKTQIKKGEYVFIELEITPEHEYSLNSTNIASNSIKYSVNSGNYIYSDGLNASGVAEVICESRRGVILKGLAPGTVKLEYGSIGDGEQNLASTTITILDSQYSTPTGNLKINASKNTDGTVKSGQTLTLTGGTVAGWNSSSWRYASVKKSGYLQTFTSGTVVIYAVTTDGRLTSATYTTQTSGSSVPIEPEPETPVDTTLKEAEDTSDDLILSFDRTTPVEFDSPESDPITVDIIKGSHNFYLTDVTCISENPGVATAQASFNMNNGDMDVTITPKGKGSTIIRIVCGGAEDSLDVNVFGGSSATTPKLEYNGQYGVSLNVYEYTEISFKVSSNAVYQALEYSVSQGREDKIVVEGGNYNSTTGVATIRVALKDHISGYVYVTYGTERLIFSIANRFNLKFENIHNFVLGVGATRYIKIYPLDDTIKASSINVYSERGNVTVSSVENGGVEQDTGKRFFLVEVKYQRAGQDMLIASRKGDDDIYLDFTCEAKSVPAQSINFNTNSITINK